MMDMSRPSQSSRLMRIFGETFCSTARAPNHTYLTIEDCRRSLDIQVCSPSSHSAHTYALVTDIETLQEHDSAHATEDALACISRLQPGPLGSSGFSEASRQVLIEFASTRLPPPPS
jgi:hypothetical protein